MTKQAARWMGEESARLLAMLVHLGQTDFQGEDYFAVHLTMVVRGLGSAPGWGDLSPEEQDLAFQAAWLHDAFEDNPNLPWAMLRALGAPERLQTVLALLTHVVSVPRSVYIEAICGDPIAKVVKQSDNRVNAKRTRTLPDDHPKKARLTQKYSSEWEVLAA